MRACERFDVDVGKVLAVANKVVKTARLAKTPEFVRGKPINGPVRKAISAQHNGFTRSVIMPYEFGARAYGAVESYVWVQRSGHKLGFY